MTDSQRIIESMLSTRDSFAAVDALVELGRLDPVDYEACHSTPVITPYLYGSADAARVEVESIAAAARAMGLAEGDSGSCYGEGWARLCWRRVATPQLDLFMDSSATRTSREFAKALLQPDIEEAHRALAELERTDPGSALVRHGPVWLEALSVSQQGGPDAWQKIESDAALARSNMQDGDAFAALLWRRLADAPDIGRHPSAALARAADWEGVLKTVESSVADSPTPPFRHYIRASRAAMRLGRPGDAARWLAGACWHPQASQHECIAMIEDLVDEPTFQDFADPWFDDEISDWALFPGWLVLCGFRFQVEPPVTAPAWWGAVGNLSREAASVAARQELAQACPTLLRLWLSRRPRQ